jgi:hypothetical protein
MSSELEKLTFGNVERTGFEATHFPGDTVNVPSIWLEIGSGHMDYDRDYNRETPITGTYDLELAEARKLHAMLGKMIEQAETWKRPARLHEFRKVMEGVSDKVLQEFIDSGKVWMVADGSLVCKDIPALQAAVMKDMHS